MLQLQSTRGDATMLYRGSSKRGGNPDPPRPLAWKGPPSGAREGKARLSSFRAPFQGSTSSLQPLCWICRVTADEYEGHGSFPKMPARPPHDVDQSLWLYLLSLVLSAFGWTRVSSNCKEARAAAEFRFLGTLSLKHSYPILL